MGFQEYPKRVYKDNDSKVVNTKKEEDEYLGVKVNDKENKEGLPGEIGEGQKPEQAQPVEEGSEKAIVGCGDVLTHEKEHGEEGTPGILKRKPGRPKRPMDERGFVPK